MSLSRVAALFATAMLAFVQQVPTRTLSTPDVEIPREFTGIDAVRELHRAASRRNAHSLQ